MTGVTRLWKRDKKEQGRQALQPFIPDELVGGAVPYIPGLEREAVWNAAAQACQTENVHFVFTVAQSRCWYLATRSALLASSPDSWCPLALALPQEGKNLQNNTIYTYAQSGMTAALHWDEDHHRLQIYLGKTRLIDPGLKAKEADIMMIDSASASPMPWQNEQLRKDKRARQWAWSILAAGLTVAAFSLVIVLATTLLPIAAPASVEPTRIKTIQKTSSLMTESQSRFRNDAIIHMSRITELLDALMALRGTLVRYEVTPSGQVEWEALVPSSFASGDNPTFGTVSTIGDVAEDGRVRIKGSR